MLLALPLTLLLSQGIIASPYVVLEENGYYSTWRSNPAQNQWPMFLSPQSYMPFLQNFNPFNWGRPQQSFEQDDREMRTMKIRQMALYNIIKCIIAENERDACKNTLQRAMILFEEPDVVLESVTNKPIVIESTIWQVKPAVPQMKPMDETPAVQEKPIVVAKPPPPLAKPMQVELIVERTKPVEVKPVEEKPLEEMKPMQVELIVERTKPVDVKPVEEKSLEQMKPPPVMTDLVLPLAESATVEVSPTVAPVQEVNSRGKPDLAEKMQPQPVMTELVLPIAAPATIEFLTSVAPVQEVNSRGKPDLVEKMQPQPVMTELVLPIAAPATVEFLTSMAPVQEVNSRGNPDFVEKMQPQPVMTGLVLPIAAPATVEFLTSVAPVKPTVVEKAAEEEKLMKTETVLVQNSPVVIEPTLLEEKVEKVLQEKPMEQPVTVESQETTHGKLPLLRIAPVDVPHDKPIDEEPSNFVKPVEAKPTV